MHATTQSEWSQVIPLLSSQPDGTKLAYSMTSDGQIRTKRPWLHINYKIQHSFIKINGKIYAVAQGKGLDAILGSGGYGKVKFIVDQEGNESLVKIGDKADLKSEAAIYLDQGLSAGFAINPRTNKYYLQMPNLGITLAALLDEKSLDNDRRFRIAIRLCLELHALHYGLKSRSHTPIIHWDLTPNNITVRGDSEVTIIDYGLSEVLTGTNAEHHRGAFEYRPVITRKITDEQAEIEYLLHCLYLPRQFPAYNRLQSFEYQNIYTHELLKDHELFPILDTSLTHRPNLQSLINSRYTALNLAAIQIVSHYGLKLPFEQLIQDQTLCLLVAQLYQRGHGAEEMRELLQDIPATLVRLYPQSEGVVNTAKVLFINDALCLGEDCETLAKDSDSLILIQFLLDHNLIRHYRTIKAIPEIKEIFLNAGEVPALLNAAKNLLMAGAYDQSYISTRWKEIRALPGIEAEINLSTEQARYGLYKNDHQISIEKLESYPDGIALFLRLQDFLHPNDIKYISQCPGLTALILADNANTDFFHKLVDAFIQFYDLEFDTNKIVMGLKVFVSLSQRDYLKYQNQIIRSPDPVIQLILLLDAKLQGHTSAKNRIFSSLLKKLISGRERFNFQAFMAKALENPCFTHGLVNEKALSSWIDLWRDYYRLESSLNDEMMALEMRNLIGEVKEIIHQHDDFIEDKSKLSTLRSKFNVLLEHFSFTLQFYPREELILRDMCKQLSKIAKNQSIQLHGQTTFFSGAIASSSSATIESVPQCSTSKQ